MSDVGFERFSRSPFYKLQCMTNYAMAFGQYSFKLPACPDVGLGLRRFTVTRTEGGPVWTYALLEHGEWTPEHSIALDYVMGNIAELLSMEGGT